MAVKKRKKVLVGDIFSIPIEKSKYAFARVINLKDGWDLAEIFSKKSSEESLTQAILDSELLYPPFSFYIRDLQRGTLNTVGHTENYTPDYLDQLYFLRGIPGRYTIIKVNEYASTSEKIIADSEKDNYPWQAFYALEGMIMRVKEILKQGTMLREWLKDNK
jgi:hypothetical protein